MWLVVLFIIGIGLILVCEQLSNEIIHPKKHVCEEVPTDLSKEEVYIDSPYGYKLHGLFFPNKDSKKFIIICHGFKCCLYTSMKYMHIFFKRGFNVLVYDNRYHGLSGGNDVSFGYFEKYDLKAWTDWIVNRFGNDIIIGTHGESMGGGTVLQNIAIDSRIKFCIADCAYSDVTELMNHQLIQRYKYEWLSFLMPLVSIATKIRSGWSFKEVSPIEELGEIDTPVLFIHGDCDDYVPTHMSRDMYKVKKGIKELYIAPNSRHAGAYCNNMEEYDEKVGEFLERVVRVEWV